MISYLTEKTKNPVLLVEFKQDRDVGMVFCANLDNKGAVEGLSLYYIRKSKGILNRTRPEVTSEIFQPKLSKVNSKLYFYISPLDEPFTLVQKGKEIICQYPFRNEKKIGKVTHIEVDANRVPLSVQFTIHGTYRASKESSPILLTETIRGSNDFTTNLYNLFTSY